MGARPVDVRRMVLVNGMAPALVGIVIGLVGAMAAGRVIAGLLYLIDPFDVPVLAAVTLLMMFVAISAIWWPAVRATRADPVTVLRAE